MHTINFIKEKKWPKKINLFSFGIGSGWYERELRDELIRLGVCEQVNIYGYDPNAKISGNDIQLITPDHLHKKNRFDFFLARWVLHHVPENERWGNLGKFLAHTKKPGLVLFVEEGVFVDEAQMSLDQRKYTLLFGALDVAINYVLSRDWLAKENFYLKFLSLQDIDWIETFFENKHPKKEYLELKMPTLRTVLLAYKF